jgi:hypothetical protein
MAGIAFKRLTSIGTVINVDDEVMHPRSRSRCRPRPPPSCARRLESGGGAPHVTRGVASDCRATRCGFATTCQCAAQGRQDAQARARERAVQLALSWMLRHDAAALVALRRRCEVTMHCAAVLGRWLQHRASYRYAKHRRVKRHCVARRPELQCARENVRQDGQRDAPNHCAHRRLHRRVRHWLNCVQRRHPNGHPLHPIHHAADYAADHAPALDVAPAAAISARALRSYPAQNRESLHARSRA